MTKVQSLPAMLVLRLEARESANDVGALTILACWRDTMREKSPWGTSRNAIRGASCGYSNRASEVAKSPNLLHWTIVFPPACESCRKLSSFREPTVGRHSELGRLLSIGKLLQACSVRDQQTCREAKEGPSCSHAAHVCCNWTIVPCMHLDHPTRQNRTLDNETAWRWKRRLHHAGRASLHNRVPRGESLTHVAFPRLSCCSVLKSWNDCCESMKAICHAMSTCAIAPA